MVMYIFYGLLLFITDGFVTHGKIKEVQTMLYLKDYLTTLLPIYSCYYYTRKGFLTEDIFSKFAVLFVVVGIVMHYRMQREALEALIAAGSNRTEVTNNSGYVVLAIIPSLMVLNKKPLLQYIGLAVCFLFLLLAMKRGAILCAMIFLMAFMWHKMKNAKGGRKFGFIFLLTIGFYFFIQFVENRLATSDYFSYRVEQTLEGNASGRDDMYSQILSHYFNDTGVIQKLVGYGANGTIKLFTNYAHNDWLEIITNQGLLGVIIFVYYCLCFWRTIRRGRLSSESHFALLVVFLMFLPQTFFSAGITNTIIFTSSMIGFALADGFDKKEITIKS